MYILLKKGNTCNNKVFKEDYMKKDIHLKNSPFLSEGACVRQFVLSSSFTYFLFIGF